MHFLVEPTACASDKKLTLDKNACSKLHSRCQHGCNKHEYLNTSLYFDPELYVVGGTTYIRFSRDNLSTSLTCFDEANGLDGQEHVV